MLKVQEYSLSSRVAEFYRGRVLVVGEWTFDITG